MEGPSDLSLSMAHVESKRSILLVTNDLGPHAGGIETFILGLIDEIEGRQLVIFTSSESGSADFDSALERKTGAIVIRDRSKVLLPTPRVTHAVKKIINQYGSEIIWFGAAAPLALMAGAIRTRNIKKIVALTHGHEVWWAKIFPFNLALRKIGNGCDVITYLGDFTRDSIKKSLGKRPELIQLAPGISTTHFQPGAKSESLLKSYGIENVPTIVSVGRLVRRKGQDRLIEALYEVKKSYPEVKLLIIGEGKYKKHLQKSVQKFDLDKNVIFIGRVSYENLPEYIRLGDIFAMPSRSRLGGLEVEGLGIVYLEAGACGLPVLAGDSGGAPDAVKVGETGYVVSGKSKEEIAQTLIQALSNSENLKRLGRNGRQWAEDYWSWKVWGERFREILRFD